MDITFLRPPLSSMPHLQALEHIKMIRADRMVSKVRVRKAVKKKVEAKQGLLQLAKGMSPEELKGLMERLGRASVRT